MRAHFAACLVVTVAVLFTLLHLLANAPKPIELAISPRMAFAPATLAIRVRVHPSEQDRWIAVQARDRFSGWTIAPCQQNEPDCRNQTLYSFIWPNIEEGAFDVIAQMGRGDLEHGIVTASDRVRVEINGIGP